MIELETPPAPANPDGEEVTLSREQLWQGLIWKAQYPTLFVSPILECRILDTFADGFLREITHKTGDGSELIQERVFLEPERKVTFLRLSGSVLGRIENVIEESAGLALRFRFTLVLVGAEHGGADEAEYKRKFSAGYLDAVNATLGALRSFVSSGEDPTLALSL